jgi:hypothetical protein
MYLVEKHRRYTTVSTELSSFCHVFRVYTKYVGLLEDVKLLHYKSSKIVSLVISFKRQAWINEMYP